MSELHEQAGEVGIDLANALATKIKQTIDGFPASTFEQRVAIARLVAHELDQYGDDDPA